VTVGELARGSDAVLVAWAAAVGLLMMAPASLLPGLEKAGETGLDKVGHFVVFLVLALLAIVPARRRTRRPLIAAALGCIFYGALLEAVQAAIGTRSAEVADVVANGLGSSVGVLLPALWRRA
jgi:VanZ family protein